MCWLTDFHLARPLLSGTGWGTGWGAPAVALVSHSSGDLACSMVSGGGGAGSAAIHVRIHLGLLSLGPGHFLVDKIHWNTRTISPYIILSVLKLGQNVKKTNLFIMRLVISWSAVQSALDLHDVGSGGVQHLLLRQVGILDTILLL